MRMQSEVCGWPGIADYQARVQGHLDVPIPSRVAAVRCMLAALLAVGALSACGGGNSAGGDSGQARNTIVPFSDTYIVDSGNNGDDPGDDTLAGLDADNDGVRDDVQGFIEQRYGHHELAYTAAREYTIGLTGALTATVDTASARRQHARVSQAALCLGSLMPERPSVVTDNLLPHILDTKTRIEAYLRFRQLLEGEMIKFDMPVDLDPASACELTSSRVLHADRSLDAVPYVGPLATQDKASCRSPHIFYANGVANSPTDAELSLLRLHHAVSPRVSPELLRGARWSTAYNPSLGAPSDFLEAMVQDSTAAGRPSPMQPFLDFMRGRSRDAWITSEVLAIYVDLALSVNAHIQNSSGVLDRHVGAYRRAIGNGERVIIVAHSQGNFFANAAYERLTPEERSYVRVIGVASPAARVGRARTPYVTHDQDRIISALRQAKRGAGLQPLPLSPTGEHTLVDSPDALHHSFIHVYLNPANNVRNELIGHIEDALRCDTSETTFVANGSVFLPLPDCETDLVVEGRLKLRVVPNDAGGIQEALLSLPSYTQSMLTGSCYTHSVRGARDGETPLRIDGKTLRLIDEWESPSDGFTVTLTVEGTEQHGRLVPTRAHGTLRYRHFHLNRDKGEAIADINLVF